MNEGESAGGGHLGSNPAPPAVPDRISTSPTTIAANSSSSNKNKQTTPTIVRIAKPSLEETPTVEVSTTSQTYSPRSFQQAFTHQQRQTPPQPTVSLAKTSALGRCQEQQQQEQQQQQHQLHMPQTSSTGFLAAGVADVTNTTTQQQAQSNTDNQSSYTPAAPAARPPISVTHDTNLLACASSSLVKRPKIDNSLESIVGSAVGGGNHGVSSNSLLSTTAVTAIESNITAPAAPQDFNALKKRILEQKYQRLRSLKEKHSENVAELFYLQSGGNMMEYPAWRKKPPTQQYMTFSNAYRLDQLANEGRAAAQTQQSQQQQQTAENIATIIGVTSSSSSNTNYQEQKQPQTTTTTTECLGGTTNPSTNPQSQPTTAATLSTTTRNISSTVANATKTTSIVSSQSTAGTISSSSNSSSSIDASGNVLPPGAEIKIPAVGATPVAVSTKLPAAVAQLTQQGGTPLVPCTTGVAPSATLRRNGNGLGLQIAKSDNVASTATTTPPPPLYSPASVSALLMPATSANGATAIGVSNAAATTSALNSSSSNAQEFSFKAKQEVYVMQRISELQREGLWTEKRLPKLQEPSRPKAHWDYLLEEMVWLAADFAQERKWKKNAAKKCAKMVQKHFQDKANAAQKAEKAQEAHLKRIAAFISKEVKMFWSNVEKLVEYKHHTKLEEKRKKALDQHLSFIVDQTEKFSQQLAEGMNKSALDATAVSTAPSINSSRISSPKRSSGNMSDDEFRPESASDDDEETIAKAEEEAADVKEEVAALEKESQMDLDDFIKDLPKGYLENRDKLLRDEEKSSIGESGGDDTDDAEFEATEASEDDENTISQQEENERGIDHKKELDELEADNDLTVEQLLNKYKSGKISKTPPANVKQQHKEMDSDDDNDDRPAVDSDDNSASEETSVESDEEADDCEDEDDVTAETTSETDENEQENGLKSLIEDAGDGNSNKDDMIKDAAALAESIQPKGNTLSSTNVVTPVPFLLKHTLREYQHIGLDWLVTMNERKLNGILADEMGLGKTIQTIALLAHLACVKANWGPHLIVVPSSVMLNWEMEFKKWCPGFKILTYYGTQKERKLKRVGWTKPNAFHVCITSYKLVVQDQQSFRRKKWKYLILDEAQNIKNFKSQRWQLLLNFSTERRLLLTGTPLQNDLMELWSLMHFLMPYVFSSHREFKEWFSNPMTGMIEGNMEYNESLISRLHKVIRPFLLRRLKKEVEKQMPKKYEHVVMCRLSNRQRYLYDDFMSRAKTRETLQAGNLLSVINVLMQLRKVCNHPNMFEVRPTISPFQMEGIAFHMPRLVCDLMEYDPFTQIDLHSLNVLLIELEQTLTAYVSYKSRVLAPPRKLIEEIDVVPEPPPRCPTGKYKFHIRIRDQHVQRNLSKHSENEVRVGASPAMKAEGNKLVPVCNVDPANSRICKRINNLINPVHANAPKIILSGNGSTVAIATGVSITRLQQSSNLATISSASHSSSIAPSPAKIAKLMPGAKPYFLVTTANTNSDSSASSSNVGGRLTLLCKTTSNLRAGKAEIASNPALVSTLAHQVKTTRRDAEKMDFEEDVESKANKNSTKDDASSEMDPIYNMNEIRQLRKEKRLSRLKLMATINRRRTEGVPIYGSDCRDSMATCTSPNRLLHYSSWQTRGYINCRVAMQRFNDNWTLNRLLKSYAKRCEELRQTFANFVIYVPSVCAPRIRRYVQHLSATCVQREHVIEAVISKEVSPKLVLLHPIISAMRTQFPDPRLIQYDCGKLQTLDRLLRELKTGQHRVLIFTQMTKMLDVLEAFLNYHGHIYLRLDGSTRVEQRQVLMERFNGDKRIFCFILSTRSGGVGVNLTGADTVIFYDSDWNPTMDAQAQDRCHRIGQTRDVHIYRLVSEKTIEVNILKKANQKRMLSDMAIEGGNFTTSYFKSSTIKDLFNIEPSEHDLESTASSISRSDKPSTSIAAAAVVSIADATSESGEAERQSLRAYESALAAAEDEQDVQATKTAKAEAAADLAEFDETIPIDEGNAESIVPAVEMSKADLEVQNLVKQLSPIERYAMRFVEETGAAWTAEQLRAAEEEIEAQKREWEANRLAALQKEEEMLKQEAEAEEMLTYSRKDASNQVNKIQETVNKTRLTIRSKQKAAFKQRFANAKTKNCNLRALAMKGKNNQTVRVLSRQCKTLPGSKKCLISNSVRICDSVSSSNRRNGVVHVTAAKSDKKVTQSLGKTQSMLAKTTNPIRKTTRTSMAAFADADDNTTAKTVLRASKLPHTAKAKGAVDGAVGTGVKNQKLLSFANKQLQKRRQLDNAIPAKRKKLSDVELNSRSTRKSDTSNLNRQLRNSRNSLKKEDDKRQASETNDDSDEEVNEDEENEDEETTSETAANTADEGVETSDEDEEEEEYHSAVEEPSDDSEQSDEQPENASEKVHKKQQYTNRKIQVMAVKKHGGRAQKTNIMDGDSDHCDADDNEEVTDESDANDEENVATNNDDEEEAASTVAAAERPPIEQGHSNSMELWNAHAQLQDTTTNSTYYNVSEESDSDDNETLARLNSSLKRNATTTSSSATTPTPSARFSRSLTPSKVTPTQTQQNHIDINSPRTRSRGSVKINLWTLDESPMLPTYRTAHAKNVNTREKMGKLATSSTQIMKRKNLSESEKVSSNEVDEFTTHTLGNGDNGNSDSDATTNMDSSHDNATTLTTSTPLRQVAKEHAALKRPLPRKVLKRVSHSSGEQNALQRWLLKTPKAVVSKEHSGESTTTHISTTNGPS